MAHVFDCLNAITQQEIDAFDAGQYSATVIVENRIRRAVQMAWEDGFIAAINGFGSPRKQGNRKVMVSESKIVNGRREWVEKGVAEFHQFGVDNDQSEDGVTHYSTAIIEWPDGAVDIVNANAIRFIK